MADEGDKSLIMTDPAFIAETVRAIVVLATLLPVEAAEEQIGEILTRILDDLRKSYERGTE